MLKNVVAAIAASIFSVASLAIDVPLVHAQQMCKVEGDLLLKMPAIVEMKVAGLSYYQIGKAIMVTFGLGSIGNNVRWMKPFVASNVNTVEEAVAFYEQHCIEAMRDIPIIPLPVLN